MGSTGGARTTTVHVSHIPFSAVAHELFDFFQSSIGPVYACKISSFHHNWKSKGFGRVQFETAKDAEEALASNGRLPLFQCARLALSRSFGEIVVRPVEPSNRVRSAVLHVGYLVEERWLEVLDSWDNVRVDFMPERQRVDVWVEHGGELYRMEIMLRDVSATFGCSLVGIEENAILFKLKYAPRLYHRIYGPSLSGTDRYYVCKEDLKHSWIRTADFSTSCSIGQSSYFCVELPEGVYAPEIIAGLPLYEDLGDLNITEREPLPSSSRLVPIINCPPEYPLAYEVLFQLNTLVHAQKISCGQLNTDLFSILTGLSIDTAKNILLKMHKMKSTCYEPVKFIKQHLDGTRANPKGHLSSHKSMPVDNLMLCHRVLITPSRVYLLGPEVETSNYVVKHHAAHASNFLRLSFVEEDWSKLPSDAISTSIGHGIFSNPCRTEIHKRILSVLSNGITIGEKNFEFLAFSASQLRSNSVWMFASSETVTAESIREWMGHFKKIRSVSKCAARMGQLFSSSIQTFKVFPQDFENIPDVEVTTDGIKYCFSDGIGKISAPFAMQLAKLCGLSETPSAFQIRYGGYKGVIAVDQYSFKKLSLRPSMLKFESNNTMLSVTKWSESMPCYLNREVICLLSTLGIQDEKLEALLREQLRLLDEVLTKKEAALKFLDSMSGGDTKTAIKMLIQDYEPKAEPYLLMVLKAYREYHLSDVRSRCRILVPKGRVLLGCLDETGNLNYGQVYIKVTMTANELQDDDKGFFEKVDETTAIIVGKVVVTKNPCLHPGDIRILQAVKDVALEETGFVDCVVFPQKGERCHPNECSGGDLDGDLYFVCWDENLIPLQADTPMDYIARRPRIMDHEVTLEEIHRFFVDYMVNDTLGAISTAHLVHADREPSKARSSKCLQLANLHSMAVDFAKTGAPAEMPKVLRPKEYPDFMERSDRPMYVSTGVLGKLYRMTIDWIEGQNFPSECPGSLGAYYDHDLEVQGFKAFLEVAEDYKNQYAERFCALMNYYGAESEDEILTGNLWKRSSYLQRDKRQYGEVKDRILASIRSLRKEVMGWFEGCCDESAYPKMAFACYHVTYHPSYCTDTNFLSFPWIFCDVLLTIKSSKVRIQKETV